MEFVPEVKRLLGLGEASRRAPLPYEVEPESLPTLSVDESWSDSDVTKFVQDLFNLDTVAKKAGTSLVAILTEGAKHMGIDLR